MSGLFNEIMPQSRRQAIVPAADAPQLVRYDAMCRAIASAYEVDEVKDIRDKAIALEAYFRLANNVEAERQACEIRLRAERRAGTLSKQLPTAPGQRTDLTSSHDTTRLKADALGRAGVSRDQASKWERLADVPEKDFEAALADRDTKPTTTGIIRQHEAKEKPKDQVDAAALWLWGRLLDFERDGLLTRDPAEVMSTMLPHMRETTLRLAPLVTEWLKRLA